jgi:hypothetical protein
LLLAVVAEFVRCRRVVTMAVDDHSVALPLLLVLAERYAMRALYRHVEFADIHPLHGAPWRNLSWSLFP